MASSDNPLSSWGFASSDDQGDPLAVLDELELVDDLTPPWSFLQHYEDALGHTSGLWGDLARHGSSGSSDTTLQLHSAHAAAAPTRPGPGAPLAAVVGGGTTAPAAGLAPLGAGSVGALGALHGGWPTTATAPQLHVANAATVAPPATAAAAETAAATAGGAPPRCATCWDVADECDELCALIKQGAKGNEPAQKAGVCVCVGGWVGWGEGQCGARQGLLCCCWRTTGRRVTAHGCRGCVLRC
jgi:hypothetical protein